MTNRFRLLSILLLCTLSAFSQSKKDQMKALSHSVDSLSTVLTTTRDNSIKKVGVLNTTIDSLNTVLSTTRDNASKDIDGLNKIIDGLNSEIAQLKSDVSGLESSTTKLTKDNEMLKLDLEELSKKNLELEAKLKIASSETSINQFVSGFYNKLELSREKNQRAYEVGSPFPNKNYAIYLSSNARIPQERLEELTGVYHYHINISLAEVISVLRNENLYEVRVMVNYGLYEVGDLINEEVLTVELKDGIPKITGWYDVKIKTGDNGLRIEIETDQNSLYSLIKGKNIQ